jgi:hypothetical protein
MLQDDVEDTRARRIDRALLAAALISFCFGLTAMMAGVLR